MPKITNSSDSEERVCQGCDIFSERDTSFLKILDNRQQVISIETAYQITSMLEGAVKRGTGKKLRDLNLNLAGKTGTTNNNTDAWFIGFTSNLVVGVYVGFDEPKPLGRYETGAKTALPIFKDFIKTAIKKKDARPFKVADNITMMVIDRFTGQKVGFTSKETIVEVFKNNNIDIDTNQNLDINNRLKNSNILRFY